MWTNSWVIQGWLHGFHVGKLADITIFDRNLIEIPEEDILQVEVTHTIVDGKIVFEK